MSTPGGPIINLVSLAMAHVEDGKAPLEAAERVMAHQWKSFSSEARRSLAVLGLSVRVSEEVSWRRKAPVSPPPMPVPVFQPPLWAQYSDPEIEALHTEI